MPDDLPRIPRHRGPKNRPSDAAWLQQKLPAHRPLLTLRCALPILIALGFVCLVLAVLLFSSALQAQEGIIDYTDCLTNRSSSLNLKSLGRPATCIFNITLDDEFKGDVYFYYALDGFYQNMRKYFRSRDDNQLFGRVHSAAPECSPVRLANDSTKIVPCGAIANSMFNDSFILRYQQSEKSKPVVVPFTSEDLLSPALRLRKYKNPQFCSPTAHTCPGFEGTAKPPAWQKHVSKLGYNTNDGRALENFDFIVWMETAALPSFRKIYRKLNRTGIFKKGLPAGSYTLKINYEFPVTAYGGRKKFIFASHGMLGRKSNFQSAAFFALSVFILTASACIFAVEFMSRSISSLLRRFR